MLCFSDVKHINTFIINNIVTNAELSRSCYGSREFSLLRLILPVGRYAPQDALKSDAPLILS